MSRSYSPSTVFRMADSSLLHDLFVAFGADVNLEDWNRITVQKVELLMSLKETLPPSNKDRLESTLIKIYSLSCSEGMQAISDAFESILPDDYDLLIQKNASPYTRALHICLNYPDMFQKSLTLMKMFQSSWSNRLIHLPKVKPSTTQETISLLESDIESICSNYKDKGLVCSVECYEKDGIFYYYAWPDDYPEDILIHDENKNLVHKIIRKTFTMAFSYDSVHGICQLSTRGPKEMKEELQDMFLIDVLGRLPRKSEIVPYNLTMFLHPNFSLSPEPGDQTIIRVTRIKLSQNGKRRVSVDPQAGYPLWSELKRCVNSEYLASSELRALEVTLSFVFRGEDGRRLKTVTFSLRDFQCTLKDETDPYTKKIIQYLKQRRIANDEYCPEPAQQLQLH